MLKLMDKKIFTILCSKTLKKCIKTSPVFVSQANNEQVHEIMVLMAYSKTCVKRPLKNRQNKELNDKSIAICSPWSILQ